MNSFRKQFRLSSEQKNSSNNLIMSEMCNIENTPNKNDNSNKEEKKKEKENKNKKGGGIFEPLEEPMVSLFENFYSKEPIKEVRLSRFLLTHKFKDKVGEYRKCNDLKLREKIKGSIKCVTPSGTFSQRRESDLIKHTGLLCIDIDSKDNPRIDLSESKIILGEYFRSLYYAGLSIGGDGIFLIFRISHPEFHKKHFAALELILNKVFHLQVDKGVKNPVSLRVGSYDAEPYYNPNPVPFTHVLETDKYAGQIIRPAIERNETRDRIERAISFIVEHRIDITTKYRDWFKVGCALAHEYGEEGRYWFHRVSRMYEKYNEGDCDWQYNSCLKHRKIVGGVKIGTFFFLCEKHGVEYKIGR